MQQDIFTMGVDIGSSASKCIIMKMVTLLSRSHWHLSVLGHLALKKRSMKHCANLVAILVRSAGSAQQDMAVIR